MLHEGIRFPLGVASAGLVILAHFSDSDIDNYLAAAELDALYGETHVAAAVRARIVETRRNGYSVNPGLLVTGSWGMGAAVFDRAGAPAWALSITGVEHRFASDRRGELGDLLLRAAHELTRSLNTH